MMALFTGRGDDGTTYAYDCDQRFTKGSGVAEALGTVDEINSFLGLLKVKSAQENFEHGELSIANLIEEVQQNLFIIQAELAGAKKNIEAEKVSKMGELINSIESELPPIKTFFVSGGTELAAMCDFARTVARRAERRVVVVHDAKSAPVGEQTLAYLNRLSSMLYALARLANHKFGIVEEKPHYE